MCITFLQKNDLYVKNFIFKDLLKNPYHFKINHSNNHFKNLQCQEY